MSKRRKPGDWVWLSASSGFVGESDRLKAQIQPEEKSYEAYCFLCDDNDCREWATLWTEPDPANNGRRSVLCHVSECEMFDEKQEGGVP